MTLEPIECAGRRLPDVPHFLPIQPCLIVPADANTENIQFRFPDPFGQQVPRDLRQIDDCTPNGDRGWKPLPRGVLQS